MYKGLPVLLAAEDPNGEVVERRVLEAPIDDIKPRFKTSNNDDDDDDGKPVTSATGFGAQPKGRKGAKVKTVNERMIKVSL